MHAGGGEVQGRGIRAADVVAGIHAQLLYRFAAVPSARVLLAPAVYALVPRDVWNAAHVLNELRPAWLAGYTWGTEKPEGDDEARAANNAWRPQWRPGYGPLPLAAGVTLVGQEGVVLSGGRAGCRCGRRACASCR